MHERIRPSAVAGSFYPGSADELRQTLQRLLAGATPAVAARAPKLLVVPHAGYAYSGPIAAQAYALLARWRGPIRRVVLLGPAHRVRVRGLVLSGVSAFATPLGRVALDATALAQLRGLAQVSVDDAAHAKEHSLEVQLPFLQHVLGAFSLVPLLVGAADAAQVAEVLERLWGADETLLIISTDLSHYLAYAEARAADRATAQRILQLDPEMKHDQACGATPLGGALLAARAHGLEPRLLDLRNSADTAGDRSRVVGYAAFAFEPGDDAAPDRNRAGAEDDAALGSALLSRAHNAIAAALELPTRNEPHHRVLGAAGAAFVTLRRQGELRGCAGTLSAQRILADEVRRHALAAAFRDPRFAPLQAEEFAQLEIEVSLPGAARPLAAASEAAVHAALQPGVDGVLLQWRGRSATFLPKVWQQLPQPREFLAALKHKAGLPADFWAEDLRLSRYRVHSFVQQGDNT